LLLIPLVEVLVAEKVDWIEDVPPLLLKWLEVGILRAKDHPRCLVGLDLAHHILLCKMDQLVLGHFESTKTQFEFALIIVAPCELYQSFHGWVQDLVQLLESCQLSLTKLLL